VSVLAGRAREIARAWVSDHTGDLPGFVGAFHTRSITTLPDDARVPETSDVDVMIVLDGPIPARKPGKIDVQGALLEVSYLPTDELKSAEQVLAHYHLATHCSRPNVILDPTGRLTKLQHVVAREFATRHGVVKRCEHGRPLYALTGIFPARHTTAMPDAIWSALTDPHRRALLELLREQPRAVNDLVDALGLSQPSTSKHLRVLRNAGLVQVTGDAQRRIYSINPLPFTELDTWLAPYRELWNDRLDALGRHLDATTDTTGET
jgi:DNA-binding transcriptional ArsR family regulator